MTRPDLKIGFLSHGSMAIILIRVPTMYAGLKSKRPFLLSECSECFDNAQAAHGATCGCNRLRPFIKGSALKALNGDTGEFGIPAIKKCLGGFK